MLFNLHLIFASCILLNFIVAPCLSARILGIVPTPSYSHQIVFHPLWRELSLRGHQVTVLTTDPVNDPSLINLTEISWHNSYKIWNKLNLVEVADGGFLKMFKDTFAVMDEMLIDQLEHPQVQSMIKNETEHFDLVMVEVIAPAMFAFAKRFGGPFILLSSLEASRYFYEEIGNPAHPVLNPDYLLPFTGELSFLDRVISTLSPLILKWFVTWFIIPHQHLMIKQHFGQDCPFFSDIVRNASLLLVNTDPIFHSIRPLVPAVIQIGGGTHLRSPQPLPRDLQNQLDGASNGFIYFSLGSNVKSKQLSEAARRSILETFSELPYLVLWKFELEDLSGKPDNVAISKWFPQQDILRHPNIKLFITQGGLQSMEEAIYNFIPIVGMPFFGDQPTNVKKIVAKGLGLEVNYQTMDKASFKSAILEVINSPKYRNRVRELAELAKDQPMTGLERAIWWTEYVLRHKGAQHLRSPAIDLPLYQYFLLDVIAFCLLVLAAVVFLVIFMVKIVLKMLKYFIPKRKIKVH